MISLSDAEIMKLAHATMPDGESDCLYDLSHSEILTSDERLELENLQFKSLVGQYTKTEAMIEAERRGLLQVQVQ